MASKLGQGQGQGQRQGQRQGRLQPVDVGSSGAFLHPGSGLGAAKALHDIGLNGENEEALLAAGSVDLGAEAALMAELEKLRSKVAEDKDELAAATQAREVLLCTCSAHTLHTPCNT